MTQPLNISDMVVGWKPGEGSATALTWVEQRIDRLKAALRLVSVVAAPSSDQEAELVRIAERLREEHPGIEVSSAVIVGDPVAALAKFAKPGSVVVAGTSRRRGMTLKYSFSFGTKLAARAAGPVALIPDGDLPVAGGVVVGVDGTPESIEAAKLAASIALSRGEELIAVHAWQEPTPWQDAYAAPDDAFIASLQKVHQDVLDQSVDAIGDLDDLTIVKRLVHAQAPWGLLDQATDASLLVVGSHSRRGIQRFLLGSVSHTVILNLECPTLVVPSRR